MKQPRLVGFFLLALTLAALILPFVTSAENELLIPLPGATTVQTSPGEYVLAFFKYAIGLAALLALGQLVFGAVQYVSSAGAPSLQENAKARIRGGILGLILLLLSVTILITIGSLDSAPTPGLALLNEDQLKAEIQAKIRTIDAVEGGLAGEKDADEADTLAFNIKTSQINRDLEIQDQIANDYELLIKSNKINLANAKASGDASAIAYYEREMKENQEAKTVAQVETLRLLGERDRVKKEYEAKSKAHTEQIDALNDRLVVLNKELEELETELASRK